MLREKFVAASSDESPLTVALKMSSNCAPFGTSCPPNIPDTYHSTLHGISRSCLLIHHILILSASLFLLQAPVYTGGESAQRSEAALRPNGRECQIPTCLRKQRLKRITPNPRHMLTLCAMQGSQSTSNK